MKLGKLRDQWRRWIGVGIIIAKIVIGVVGPRILRWWENVTADIKVIEISEDKFHELVDEPWISLERYRYKTHLMKCQDTKRYLDPESTACSFLWGKTACVYKWGHIEVADEPWSTPDSTCIKCHRALQWSNEIIEYLLPSGVTIYEVRASECNEGPVKPTPVTVRRFYTSFGRESSDELSSDSYYYVSPGGDLLLGLTWSELLLWNIKKGEILKRQKHILSFGLCAKDTAARRNTYYCSFVSLYSVKGKPNACICRISTEGRYKSWNKMPEYYLISW